jgi:hypothetical protein
MVPPRFPLDLVGVASPCGEPWEAMHGDDRVRFCGRCRLNVYNFSGMTRAEAEGLLRAKGGALCVRFFRRGDGTVLTHDCPVGWRAARLRLVRTLAAAASLVSAFLIGPAWAAAAGPRCIRWLEGEPARREIAPPWSELLPRAAPPLRLLDPRHQPTQGRLAFPPGSKSPFSQPTPPQGNKPAP